MPKGDAAKKKAEARAHDEWLRCLGLLNATFGKLTWYDKVPTFRRLPMSHCPNCLTPFTGATFPRCGWCGEKVSR